MRDARGVLAPLGPLALVLLLAGFGVLGGASPTELDLRASWLGPSWRHPLGNGDAGVDLLALVAHATLRALVLALAVAASGLVLGTALGTAAGYRGGRAERLTLAACDLVQAFPGFLLALAVLSAVRVPGRVHLGVVFCLTAWAPFTRLALVQARALRDAQFVEAARALGLRATSVVTSHVLPNLLGPVAIQIGSAAAGVVLGETALGFVGLGPADGVSLGALLEQGTVALLRAPHVALVGGVAVTLVSGSLQLASEGLRRRLARA